MCEVRRPRNVKFKEKEDMTNSPSLPNIQTESDAPKQPDRQRISRGGGGRGQRGILNPAEQIG